MFFSAPPFFKPLQFDEKAAAAYQFMKKEKGESAERSAARFEEARKRAVDAVGGCTFDERDHPTGVRVRGKKYCAEISWGGKKCSIGTFNSVGKAASAYQLMKKEKDAAKPSLSDPDEAAAKCEMARKRSVETVGGATARGLSKDQKKVVMAYIADAVKRGGKFQPSQNLLENLIAMMPVSEKDDRRKIKKQTQRLIKKIRYKLKHDDAYSVAAGSAVTNMSLADLDPEKILIGKNFGKGFEMDDSSLSSLDDDCSIDSTTRPAGEDDDAMAARVADDVVAIIANLRATGQAPEEEEEEEEEDQRKPPAKRNFAAV